MKCKNTGDGELRAGTKPRARCLTSQGVSRKYVNDSRIALHDFVESRGSWRSWN